jgi:hypothetical protein
MIKPPCAWSGKVVFFCQIADHIQHNKINYILLEPAVKKVVFDRYRDLRLLAISSG